MSENIIWRARFTKFEGYRAMCINCRQIIDKGIKFTFTRNNATIIKYMCEECYRISRDTAEKLKMTEEEYVEALLKL